MAYSVAGKESSRDRWQEWWYPDTEIWKSFWCLTMIPQLISCGLSNVWSQY